MHWQIAVLYTLPIGLTLVLSMVVGRGVAWVRDVDRRLSISSVNWAIEHEGRLLLQRRVESR